MNRLRRDARARERFRGAAAAALAALLLLPLAACSSLFHGFSLLPPAEAQRLPVVVDVAAQAVADAALDPSVTPLLDDLARSSCTLIRVQGEVAPHMHEHSDETIYMLSGHGRMLLGREWREVREGMLIHVPKGVPHAYRNDAAAASTALVTHTPPLVSGDRVPIAYDP